MKAVLSCGLTAGEGVRTALVSAALQLAATSLTARLDAELLMAHALGTTREAMLLHHLDTPAPAAFAPLLARRARGEPVAYITGRRDFWTLTLAVTPVVLIPRADSETLIEAAIAHFAGRAPNRILDLGTGSGALLLAALDEWPGASGIGIDRSAAALEVARGNAEALGFADRARFAARDWAEGIAERFDLVLCNPPYVEHDEPLPRDVAGYEPHGALFAGHDGLACYRALAPQFPRLIAPGGVACVEIGSRQADEACAILAAPGLTLAIRRDLGGNNRCLTLAA